MEKLNVAIADDNERMLRELGDIVGSDEELQVVGTAKDGEEAYEMIKKNEPDVVLLDIVMPKLDGLTVMDKIRNDKNMKKHPAFIMISAIGQEKITEDAFSLGADYYIMKPFAMTVLLAKIQALLRRNKQTADAEEIIWDHNSFNPLTNILTNGNGTAQLTPTEGAMLQVLLSHRNKTVSKEQLLQWLWQGGKYLNENTLNVNISRLRTKLSTIGLRQCIHTERGLGYRLVENNE